MGLSDRDYARTPSPRSSTPGRASFPSARRFGAGSSVGGVGSLRMLSVNTWIIVINVAVFLLANVLLGGTTAQFSAGIQRAPSVSQAEVVRGRVERGLTMPIPNSPYYGHPIRDPATGSFLGFQRIAVRPIIDGYGHFSTGKALELQVWRFLTFQFLHANLVHLAFNMVGLWFVGSLVEEYLGAKRYLAFYLLSGIAGAVVYLILNAIGYAVQIASPNLASQTFGLLFNDTYTPLVGASAGVFGVLMGAAFIAPTEIVYVFNIIPMKMRTAVYGFLLFALANLILGGANAGGDAAHVGGAFAGFYFIRHTHLLRDFFQLVGGPPRKPQPPAHTPPPASELDRLLDKVHTHGMASLTDAERKTLRQSTTR